MKNINVIGVPLSYGCGKNGPHLGPDILRDYGLIDAIQSFGHSVYDLGNICVPAATDEDKFASAPDMKFFKEVYQVTNNLAEVVANSLSAGKFPLIIGGDHSVGLGVGSGVSSQLDNLAIIWVDAHADINTNITSPSKNMHGMPLAALMGVGDERLVNLYRKGVKVKPENVVLMGCRSIDEGELALIDELDLQLYTTENIKQRGVIEVFAELEERFAQLDVQNIHLSLDIDVLDAQFVPGTGTRVENGINLDELYTILDRIIATGKLRSMGLVELNPRLDEDNRTTKLCIEIVKYVAERL